MPRSAVMLLLINALGGALVLGSYVWGVQRPGVGEALWGGVPDTLRPLYTLNMFLAAGGYFLFTPYVLFRVRPEETRIAGRLGYGLFLLLYSLILIPSALWLPLTAQMIAAPSSTIWALVRIDLALVGFASLGLLASLMLLPNPPRGRGLAVIGLVPFCLQTALLDATIWPAFFPFH